MNDRPAAAAPAREGQAASNNHQPPSLTSEAAVQRYLEEMRKGKSNAAILQALSEASFPPPSPVVVGDFGEEGAELGSEEEARRIWQDRGWLPAVHGPYEEDRRRLMAQHRLHSVEKLEGVDRIADLAQSIFEVPIVVVSLVLEDREKFSESICPCDCRALRSRKGQYCLRRVSTDLAVYSAASTIGWDKDERDPNFPRISIPLASALCPHRMVVLEDDTEPCLILADAKEDWRFRNNPYVSSLPSSAHENCLVSLPKLTLRHHLAGPRRWTGHILRFDQHLPDCASHCQPCQSGRATAAETATSRQPLHRRPSQARCFGDDTRATAHAQVACKYDRQRM